MNNVYRFMLAGVIVLSFVGVGCVGIPYPDSHRTSVITNQETGETSIVDTTEETSIPPPWDSRGTALEWSFNNGGWYYLGMPYEYYGAPYFIWGLSGLYGANYIYQSTYWCGSRWYGYRGHGPGWHGYNNKWHGGTGYHGSRHGLGHRGTQGHQGTRGGVQSHQGTRGGVQSHGGSTVRSGPARTGGGGKRSAPAKSAPAKRTK